MTVTELHDRLHRLDLEWQAALEWGLIDACESYRRDLEDEMASCRAALVGVAVTEIAVLRAQLSEPQTG